jgi:hypothetical protein
MSNRITWRSRPRSEYPWPLRTRRITTTDLYNGNLTPYLIGPLDMAAVLELLYRVDEFDCYGGLTMDLGSGPGTLTISATLDVSGGTSEILQFKDHQHGFDGDLVQGILWRDASDSTQNIRPLTDYELRDWETDSVEVYHDIDIDQYWLHGRYEFTFAPDAGPVFSITNDPTADPGFDENLAEFSLVLASGTYTLKGIVYTAGSETYVSNTLTITANLWHPFATTAAVPAWTDSTGAPANGGPGA